MLIKAKPFNKALVICRLQPPHKTHFQLIDSAFDLADEVIVALGSHCSARSIRNPWTTSERSQMIRAMFPDRPITIITVNDYMYNFKAWMLEVQMKVAAVCKPDDKVVLYGHKKDASTSHYLNELKQIWPFRPFNGGDTRNSTDIRTALFGNGKNEDGSPWYEEVPVPVSAWLLNSFVNGEEFAYLKEEHEFVVNERKKISGCHYPYQAFTADAIVVKSGYVLMVERRAMPGRGLLAFPGGFVQPWETPESAMLRELKEETNISINKSDLRDKYIKGLHPFADPYRDVRYRIVTIGFFLDLGHNGPFPVPKAGDDAAKAFFVPWFELLRQPERIFGDHLHMLNYFLGITPNVN